MCCRRNGAAGTVDDLTDFDAQSMAEHGLRTPQAYALERWWRARPHLRWSRIADRFEVTPH